MLEAAILLALMASLMMARKGRGRRRAYLRGKIDHNQLMGTLAGVTAITANLSSNQTLVQRAWLSSIVCTYAIQNYTPGGTVGPLIVGVCHSDYVATEVDSWMESNSSWDTGDMIAREIGQRKMRVIGVFRTPTATNLSTHLNDGKPIRTKCGWQLEIGQTVKFFFYNDGTTAFATTDPRASCNGYANLWPN